MWTECSRLNPGEAPGGYRPHRARDNRALGDAQSFVATRRPTPGVVLRAASQLIAGGKGSRWTEQKEAIPPILKQGEGIQPCSLSAAATRSRGLWRSVGKLDRVAFRPLDMRLWKCKLRRRVVSDIRTVTVTSCTPKKRGDGTVIQGQSDYGTWTLHEILATDETGLPIQEPVVCFKAINLGEQQLEFTPKDSPEYGRSWTVKPLKGARLPPQPTSPADDGYEMVRESVQLLADRVGALEQAVKGLGGFGSTFRQTDVPATVDAPVAAAPIDDSSDIPF